LVSAAAQTIPQELVEQLKIGGIMVIPVNNDILRIKRFQIKRLKLKDLKGSSLCL